MNAPTLSLARFTTAEFEQMARTGAFGSRRVELRRGLMVEMSAQHVPHTRVKPRVKHRLTLTLEAALKGSESGFSLLPEVSVDFGADFEPIPDIVIWDETAVVDQTGPIPGAAVKLVVEVADSTLPEDLGDKLAEYAAAALPEYWVADVKNGRVLRHAEPVGETYARCDVALFGEIISALTFPLAVDTSTLT
jgi:Uma2 family endonuclease